MQPARHPSLHPSRITNRASHVSAMPVGVQKAGQVSGWTRYSTLQNQLDELLDALRHHACCFLGSARFRVFLNVGMVPAGAAISPNPSKLGWHRATRLHHTTADWTSDLFILHSNAILKHFSYQTFDLSLALPGCALAFARAQRLKLRWQGRGNLHYEPGAVPRLPLCPLHGPRLCRGDQPQQVRP